MNELQDQGQVPPQTPGEPGMRLFSPRAVGLATFLGSPLAGAILMSVNYRRLGRPTAAWTALGAGVIGTALLLAAVCVLPESTPALITAVPAFLITCIMADRFQGRIYRQHREAGGRKASALAAAGVGVACMALILAPFGIAYILAEDLAGDTLTMPSGDEVYYTQGVSEDEALHLGRASTDVGYFGRGECGVQLAKGERGPAVSFIMQPNAWENQEVHGFLAEVTEILSRDLYEGGRLEVRLCDEWLQPKWKMIVGGDSSAESPPREGSQ